MRSLEYVFNMYNNKNYNYIKIINFNIYLFLICIFLYSNTCYAYDTCGNPKSIGINQLIEEYFYNQENLYFQFNVPENGNIELVIYNNQSNSATISFELYGKNNDCAEKIKWGLVSKNSIYKSGKINVEQGSYKLLLIHAGDATGISRFDFEIPFTATTEYGSFRGQIYPSDSDLRIFAKWKLNSGHDLNWKAHNDIISNLPVGNYKMEFSDVPGWNTPPDLTCYVSANSITDCGSGREYTRKTYSISGRVVSRNFPFSGISGVTILPDKGSSATTDADGYYTLTNIEGGSRTITASHNDYWATDSNTSESRSINLTENTTNFNFTQFSCKATPEISIHIDQNPIFPGDTIFIDLTLQNSGTDLTNSLSYIDVSFDNSQVSVGSVTGIGWTKIDNFDVGSAIYAWNSSGAKYLKNSSEYLISALRSGNFSNNSSYSIRIPITVNSDATGEIIFKYRGTIADKRDPFSTGSGSLDQQGLNTKTQTISVIQPGVPQFTENVNNIVLVAENIGETVTVQDKWWVANFGEDNSRVDYDFFESCNWLTLSPSQGELLKPSHASDKIHITASGTGLQQGKFNCDVSLTSTDPNNPGPFNATVTFLHAPAPGPDWTVTRNWFLELGPYEPGQLIPVEVHIKNAGTGVAPPSRARFTSSERMTEIDEVVQYLDIPEIQPGETLTLIAFAWCGPNTQWLNIVVEVNIDNLDEWNPYNNIARSYFEATPGDADTDFRVLPSRLHGNTELKTAFYGDPVNTATGNFVHHSTDLSIPSRISDFTFTRFYNSQSSEIGPLGRGWRHSFMYSMDLQEEGNPGVIYPDGYSEYWRETNGEYVPLFPQIFNKLEKNGSNWVLTKKDLTTVTFDSTGRCLGYADKNGNAVVFGYTGDELTTVIDPAGRILSLIYSGSKLTSVQDWTGRNVQFSYSGDNLSSVSDTKGNVVGLRYDAANRLDRITDQRGVHVVTLLYDEMGRAIHQTDGEGNETLFEYDAPERFSTRITDGEGNTSVHVHNSSFQLMEIVDELGRPVKYAYDPVTKLRSGITDKHDNDPTLFAYDSRGNLLQATYADGTQISYTYNSLDLPLSMTDQMGNQTTWTYDAKGNMLTETDALNNTRSWTYNAFGQKLSETDRNGASATFTYDVSGRLTRMEDADGVGMDYGYDDLWRQTSISDDRGNVTTTVYNADDTIAEVRQPIGTKRYGYDNIGNVLTEEDANGNVTTYEYDGNNNRTRVILPAGKGTTTHAYDGVNRLISTTDGRSNVWQRTYYIDGRLHKEIDPLGNEKVFTYDANGNVLTLTDGSGKTVTSTYDEMNRLLTTTDGESNTVHYAYDLRGLRTSITDARDNQNLHGYDALGRLESVRVKAANPDDDALTVYVYDKEGRLRTVTDAEGSVWENRYSAAGRRIKRIDGLGRETGFSYDDSGNLMRIDHPNGEWETFTYDQNNRRTGLAYSDGRSAAFTLDAHGNTIRKADWTGTTQYIYDEVNRLTSVTDPFGKTVQYGYDLAGKRTSITYPSVGSVGYAYDERGALQKVTDWNGQEFIYALDGAQRPTSRTFPNGIVAHYGYDNAGRLTALDYQKGAETLLSYTLTLDPNGNPTNVTSTGLPDIDALYGKNLSYTHDLAHQMLSDGENAYTYDQRGAMSQREQPTPRETTYDFSADGMLQQYATDDGTVVANLFDASRHRLGATRNGEQTRYVLDRQRGMENVLMETAANGSPTRSYVHGDQTLAMYPATGQASRFYLSDPFGNIVALTDAQGAVTDTYRYDPFGKVIGETGTSDNPFKFVGAFGVMEEPAGLSFMRARYYDPEQGRFVSVDPVEGRLVDPVTFHRYTYGANNTFKWMDPDGEDFIFVPLLVVGVVSTTVISSAYLLALTIDTMQGNTDIWDMRHDLFQATKTSLTTFTASVGLMTGIGTIPSAHKLYDITQGKNVTTAETILPFICPKNLCDYGYYAKHLSDRWAPDSKSHVETKKLPRNRELLQNYSPYLIIRNTERNFKR